MGFTWNPKLKFTQDEFNAVLKQVIEATDKPLFLNGGEFYGMPDRHENLKKIGKFFETYPEYADKVYVSIKSGVNDHWAPVTSAEELRPGVEAITKYLAPLYAARKSHPKSLDMYTLARLGDDTIENVLERLNVYVKSGEIKSICLSEVSAQTIQKALATGAPIGAVELEFSLFSREAVENGVFEICAKNNIPVICYSPLGKGLLAGLNPKDVPEGDMRRNFDRFQGEIYEHNKKLVEVTKDIAERKKVTPAQVALSFITSLSNKEWAGVKYPQLVPIPGSTKAARQIENFKTIQLFDADLKEIHDVLDSFKVKGSRYTAAMDAGLYK